MHCIKEQKSRFNKQSMFKLCQLLLHICDDMTIRQVFHYWRILMN
jgi:hypothetical protein